LLPGRPSESTIMPSRVGLSLLLVCLWLPSAAAAIDWPPLAPALPPPTGRVVNAATVGQLEAAIRGLTSHTTIIVAPGVYELSAMQIIGGGLTDVTIRGATGDRDDVVIRGGGMTTGIQNCFLIQNARRVTFAHISIGRVRNHPIQAQGENGARDLRLHDVRLFDGGQQLLKGSAASATPGSGVNRGRVEYSVLEYTTMGPPDGYTNGIDVHAGSGWTIRWNLFRNITTPVDDYLGPAILMWRGSRNTTVNGNVFIDCDRPIMLGLEDTNPPSHRGGVVCNNLIYRRAGFPWQDSAISLWNSPRTKVVHNTVFFADGAGASIEWRFDSAGLAVQNNLANRELWDRSGGPALVAGNSTEATAALFVDPASADLHLRPSAGSVIDRALAIATCPVDLDGDRRPAGPARDVGADEIPRASGG
jgi:hypothetical protein